MASSGSSSTSSGPVATGSRRRRLVLRLSQKDALQALFQQNPYPGIATRERLARELGIAESRVQVWFQNQRRRRFKQSRSPPEHVHQEGEAGPTSTPAPPSRPPRPQSSSPGNLASALPIGPRDAFAENGPAGAALGLTDQRPGGQAGCRMGAAQAPARYGFKTEELGTPAEPERARRRSSHDSSCSRGPKDPTRGEHATLGGPSCSVWGPAFWVPGTAPGVCVGQPLMIFMVQPSPGALWPSGKPPPPAQAHPASKSRSWPPRASRARRVLSGVLSCRRRGPPSLPGSPSLLEEILAATATRDTPWSPPGGPCVGRGVEAT
nr:double homeobox protein 4C-like [Ovis aries]